jgi:cytochrome b subunit of formate dehydrogenase
LDFFRHVAWFLGLAGAPQFDRWGYWEKFDFWAVFWGIPVLAVTGLLLTFPVLTGRYLPGRVLIPALWIHRIEALLAMAHVFIIHFFIVHLRRHNFPMDRAIFEGNVDLEAME